MTNTSPKTFNLPKGKTHFLFCVILSAFFAIVTFSFIFFIPAFIEKPTLINNFGSSLAQYLHETFFVAGNAATITGLVFYWIFATITAIITFLGFLVLIKQLFTFVQLPKWYNNYINETTKIINSCDLTHAKYKVAMVVCTCNDVLPNTILQTSRQTYKNMDVWISDDSTKPDIIEQIDSFCKEHGFHVLHRDPNHKKQHPTKIGNLFYFLDKYGSKYDYIFENDSSSLITPNFVANALCFLNTPLYNHDNDGAVIANGSFIGIQTLLPYLYTEATRLNESMGLVGTTVELSGNTVQLNGWGALFKTSTLKSIPLEKVECPSCDMTRGFWLTIHGKHNYLNPFDFASKLCPPNAEGIKNQWLKWTGGDVFSFREGLSWGYFSNKYNRLFTRLITTSKVIVVPLAFVNTLLFTITMVCLSPTYWSWSPIIMLLFVYLAAVIVLVVAIKVNHLKIHKIVLFALFFLFMGIAMGYKLAFQTFKCWITGKWSSGAVTIKGAHKATAKQKFLMGRFDYIIILVTLTICLLLNFLVPELNKGLIWVVIFGFVTLPSIFYIILIWVGDIKVKRGWYPTTDNYEFWLSDHRYDLLKNSEVWRKQH